ncbi:MAG: cell division ATP-binding protein FtsE [Candidatus Dormibacteraceae bacterium]
MLPGGPFGRFGRPGAILLRNVSAGYEEGPVLSAFDLEVQPGEFLYLIGPSGSGKSTLLQLLYGTMRPRRGSVVVDGIPVHELHSWQTARIRRRVGCVFQAYELLAHLTALENVVLPLRLAHPRLKDPLSYALDALELVGLQNKVTAFPNHLSGGEQQRVAVARAIAHQPHVLLADEPTGNLDSETSAEIMEIFRLLNKLGSTVVMATHDDVIQSRYPARTIRLGQPVLPSFAPPTLGPGELNRLPVLPPVRDLALDPPSMVTSELVASPLAELPLRATSLHPRAGNSWRN